MLNSVAKTTTRLVLRRVLARHGSGGRSLFNTTRSLTLRRALCKIPGPPIMDKHAITTGDLPTSGIPGIEAEITLVKAEIVGFEGQIELIDLELEMIENALSTAEGVKKQTLVDRRLYLRDEKKQLRDRVKGLQDEKKQLRDKEILLMQAERGGTRGAPLCLISLTSGSPPHVVLTVLDTICRLLPDSCCFLCAVWLLVLCCASLCLAQALVDRLCSGPHITVLLHCTPI
jgi:hypothetical protein